MNQIGKTEGKMYSIVIYDERVEFDCAQVMEFLQEFCSQNHNITFRLEKAKIALRGGDPSIITALIGASGVAIGALITGILQLLKQKSGNKLVIKTQKGSTIEVSSDFNIEKIDSIIDKIQKLESEPVTLTLI